MFSLDVVDTDAFQDLPVSSRYLYYELGMRADDDGFMKSPKKLLRTIGCTEDDLLLLIAKGFAIKFDSGVIVITDWRINNTLKGDRYHPSICKEKEQLGLLPNKRYFLLPQLESNRNQDGTNKVPQKSREKVSVEEYSSSQVEFSGAGSAKPVDNFMPKDEFMRKVGAKNNDTTS